MKSANKLFFSLKRIASMVLAVLVMATVMPFSAFISNAEPSTPLDGTFESYTLNESPVGWTLVGNEAGGSKYHSNPTTYTNHYLLTVSNQYDGRKALCLSANDGANKATNGYVSAQSPAISVLGGKQYFFDYTMKTVLESSEKNYYGGRIFVVEYDASGNQINRVRIGSDPKPNTDWKSYTVTYTTMSNAKTVKLEFYLGGPKNSNYGAKFLVDDVSFETLSEDKLLNGGLEETKANGDLYSWYLRACTNINEDSTNSGYVTNHELKLVDGYHGKAAQITKKGAGYVTLTSNLMKSEAKTTYIVDYALKITNCVDNTNQFLGAALYIAEFDANKNLIKRTRMHAPIQEKTDWKEFSFSYSPEANVKYFRLELYCGDNKKVNTFTVLFDDVAVTPFTRSNEKNNVNNGDFEEVFNGTFFDWKFDNVKGTKYSSTFNGYNGTKGLLVQRKGETAGYGMIRSNLFDVTPGQEFKATYMVRFDNFEGKQYSYYSLLYATFYDKDGKQISSERINEADYHPKSVDWARRQSYHTVPENAVKCQIAIRVNGSTYDCWIDDVRVTYLNSKENGFGFNKTDANGEIYGWTVSNPAAAKLDTKVYREGTGSLFISQFVDKTRTYIYSDTLIPVAEGAKYELTFWVKSYDCDIGADGIIVNAYTYDKTGKFLGTGKIIAGRVMTLNNDSTPSNWRQVVCGAYGTEQIAYVRPVIEIPYGQVNLWIDDVECTAYSLNNEFYEDFNAVRNDGVVDGWTQTVEDGAPKFETYNSIASITAEDSDDIGVISARWDTRMEYKSMKFAMNYATKGDTEAKVTIKFYNFNDQEIVADRIEKEFDSTAGEYMEAAFDFVLMTAKFMRIEISNTEDGVLLIDDVVIVSVDEEKDEDEITWRGYWVWHNEDYQDSINGTPRYFRYHFTLPDTPVASSLQITADDRMKLWVNGEKYEDDQMNMRHTEVSVLDTIHESLKPGDNVIAVAVTNFTAYAGLIFDGFAEMADGTRIDFYSTTHIISSKVEEEGWFERDFDDSEWGNSKFMDYNAGGTWPDDLVYDKSPYIKDKFEVVDYTITENLIAGDYASLTMTIIPAVDFKKDMELNGNLWLRNSSNKVMSVDMELISGPQMSEWRAGEQITVTFSFNIPDFIASGKYIIQLETNQIMITNYDIFNNKFVKAINVTNNTANQELKAELVNVNGTIAVSVNGEIRPFNMMKKPHTILANGSSSIQYMHEAGICITRIANMMSFNKRTDITMGWNGIDDYDWSYLDSMIYTELSLHPDTYLMPSLFIGVRDWWVAQHPDQLVVDSNGDTYDVSFFSEEAYEVALKGNLDMIEHMMSQPYWNRIIAFNLLGGADTEYIWYGSGPSYTIDYSKPAHEYFRKWLTQKYGTDAALQKAWHNNSVTLKTAAPPKFEQHQSEKYDSIYDPQENAAARDFAECMEDREIEMVKTFYAAVAEKINDSRFLGSYFGYLYTRVFYNDAIRTVHTKIDEFLDDPNLDFLCAPGTYSERLDGMAAATTQMIDGVLRKGKAVLIEDDYRTCSYINLAKNFYTRDSVGTSYNVNDTLSAFIKNQAICLTQGASLWYSNIEAIMYEREQFSRVIEVLHGERYIDLSREKSYTGDVAYIMDEDGYEQFSSNQSAIYEPTYEMLYEQKYDLARAGIMTDYYSMGDLVDGIVPDYKVYVMINTMEIDAEEKAAIEKHLKNKGKIVLWQWLAGASDRYQMSEKNMSEIIGMDVKFNTSELVLKSIISNKKHWLTDGVEGTTIGSGIGYRVTSPVAYVTDKDTNIAKLGHMYDSEGFISLAVMENENWTSIFSSVPGYNVKMIRNVLKKAGVHIYSDNLNDVIYANSNYVGINAAYGGEKVLKLDGTYAVYDVVGQTTYSTSTDEIKFTMEDNQTKIFRLMPVNTNIIYVNTMYKGTLEGEAYNEVMTGDDFSAKITADDGYVISQIITDTERKTINRSSYTVEFDDVDNSHYVRVIFAPAGSVEESADYLVYILIGAGVLLVVAAAVFFIIFFKRKKKEEPVEEIAE